MTSPSYINIYIYRERGGYMTSLYIYICREREREGMNGWIVKEMNYIDRERE